MVRLWFFSHSTKTRRSSEEFHYVYQTFCFIPFVVNKDLDDTAEKSLQPRIAAILHYDTCSWLHSTFVSVSRQIYCVVVPGCSFYKLPLAQFIEHTACPKMVHVEMHHFDQQLFNIFQSILYDLLNRLFHQNCFFNFKRYVWLTLKEPGGAESSTFFIISQLVVIFSRWNFMTFFPSSLALNLRPFLKKNQT